MFDWKPKTRIRPVAGYENNYEIDQEGNVFRTKTKRRLKQYLDYRGYLRVRLSLNGVVQQFKVHRLVAQAFISNPNNLPQVNHKDCNKQNNHYSNLEWCTQRHNIHHAIVNGIYKSNNKSMSKPIIGTHVETKQQITFDSASQAQREGFNAWPIFACCHGTRRTHKGYSWRYL